MENKIEVKEANDHKMAFTKEEADKIRSAVQKIQEEVAEALEKSRDKKVQGRSR